MSEQGCGLSIEASTTRNFSCLRNRGLTSGAVVALAKGASQLALNDPSSGVIRYPGSRLHFLSRGCRGASSFETGSAEVYGTVDEDLTC